MKLTQTLLASIALGSLALAQKNPRPMPVDLPLQLGFCRPMAPIHLTEEQGPSVQQMVAGPLVIVPQWDSSVMSSFDEPYAITSTTNRLSLKINGLVVPTFTLTTGSRSAAQVAAELNANGVFAALANAIGSNAPNGYGMTPEFLYIRSKGVTFGSIEVLNTTSSANAALGLTLGLHGPDAGPARRVVFEQAFADWEAKIQDGGNIMSPYTVRIGYSRAYAGGGLASGSPLYNGSGNIVGGYMDFDSTDNWFEDPTPWDDSEYQAPVPPAGMDLLMIVRHELGHALGWVGSDGLPTISTVLTVSLNATATVAVVSSTAGFFDVGSFTVNGERIPYTSKTATLFLGLTRGENAVPHVTGAPVVCDNIYDPTRLNIAVFDQGVHTHHLYHPDDLMVTSFNYGERKAINNYPTLARVSRGQGARVPLAMIDPVGSPTPDGRASFPWPNLTSAASASPWGVPFLLVGRTYPEPGLTIASAHELLLVRDAQVLVH